MRPLFSIVTLCRNESRVLPRFIKSLEEFLNRGGSVCILDTGSSDGSADLARSSGCQVTEVNDKFITYIDQDLSDKINQKFIVQGESDIVQPNAKLFDFASARNHIASLAPTDMVLVVDCDEYFTKLDIDYINDLITQGYEQFETHFIFAHDHEGKPLIQFIQSRFYDRRVIEYSGIVHEVLTTKEPRETKMTQIPREYYMLEHGQQPGKDHRGGYMTGLALDCYQHPEKDRQSHYFSREMMYNGRYHSAIKEFQRHIQMQAWPIEASQSIVHIADCWMELKEPAKAMENYLLAFDREPGRREPLMKIAEFYRKYNQPKQTLAFASAASTVSQVPFYANYQPYYEHLPHELMYWAYKTLGQPEQALKQLREGLKYNVLFEYPSISIILPTLGREEGLLKCLESIKNLNYPSHLIETLVLEDIPRLGVPQRVAQGLKESTGEFICFAANDIIFDRDCLKQAVMNYYLTGRRLISFNEGPLTHDLGNICTHFMIKRDLVPEIGDKIFDTRFHHVAVDNLLWAKASKLGQAYHSKTAKITHNHFSKGAPWDSTYELGWSKVEEDRKILKEELEKLELN